MKITTKFIQSSVIFFTIFHNVCSEFQDFMSSRRRPVVHRSSPDTMFPILSDDFKNSVYDNIPSVLVEKLTTTRKPVYNPPAPLPILLKNGSNMEKTSESNSNAVENKGNHTAEELMKYYYSTFLIPQTKVDHENSEKEMAKEEEESKEKEMVKTGETIEKENTEVSNVGEKEENDVKVETSDMEGKHSAIKVEGETTKMPEKNSTPPLVEFFNKHTEPEFLVPIINDLTFMSILLMQMPLIVPLVLIPLAFVVAGTMLIPVVRLNHFFAPYYALEGLAGRGVGSLISSTAPIIMHKLSRAIESQEECWERLVCNTMGHNGESEESDEGYIFPYFKRLLLSKYWETPLTKRMYKFLKPDSVKRSTESCAQYKCSYYSIISNLV